MRSMTLPIMLTLAAACIAGPAAAQDALACTNEVQRVSEGFPAASGRTQGPAVTPQQPGTRIDAGANDLQQRQIRQYLQQARTAGEQGDGTGCMENLNQARTLLRQTGVGSGQPGNSNAQGTQPPSGSSGGGSTASRPGAAPPLPTAPNSVSPDGASSGNMRQGPIGAPGTPGGTSGSSGGGGGGGGRSGGTGGGGR